MEWHKTINRVRFYAGSVIFHVKLTDLAQAFLFVPYRMHKCTFLYLYCTEMLDKSAQSTYNLPVYLFKIMQNIHFFCIYS